MSFALGRPPRSDGLSNRRRRQQSDLDAKNIVSWRVPNSPKPSSGSDAVATTPFNTDDDITSSNNRKIPAGAGNRSSRSSKRKSDASSASHTRDHSPDCGYSTDDLKSLTAESDKTSVGGLVDFQDRCWKMLYSNIDHAVDELYDLCEEEEDITRCLEAINLLHLSTRDFTKLIEKIQTQKHFDDMHPSSISWEVRKPRRPSQSPSPSIGHSKGTNKPSGSSLTEDSPPHSAPQPLRSRNNSLDMSIAVESTVAAINRLDEQFKSFTPKVLRPDAQPFVPQKFLSSPTIDTKSCVDSATNPSKEAKEINSLVVTPGSSPFVTPLTSPMAANALPTGLLSPVAEYAGMPLFRTTSKSPPPTLSSPTVAKASNSQNTPKVSPKLSRSSEQGNAMKVGKSPTKVSNVIIPTRLSRSTSHNSSNGHEDHEDDLQVQHEVALASEEVWKEAEAWIDAEAALEDAAWNQLQQNHGNNESSDQIATPCDDPLFLDDETLQTPSPLSTDKSADSRDVWTPQFVDTPPNHAMNPSHQGISHQVFADSPLVSSFLAFRPIKSISNENLEKMKSLPGSDSPNRMPANSTPSSLSGRSLHVKLSSPDRRKITSPTDLKRKTEARLTAAAMSRDKNVEEKKMKAVKFLTRVHEHKEKAAQKLAQAEQILEDRLKDASKRHGDHIKSVRGKASNENTKVSEVIFINSLNADEVANQLQRRLNEVESRVLAAAQRREERLADITIQRQRRNSRKSQQMSELRLSIEKQQMERWKKLQERLEAVQSRREARLQEVQRRTALQQANQSNNMNNDDATYHAILKGSHGDSLKNKALIESSEAASHPQEGFDRTEEAFHEGVMIQSQVTSHENKLSKKKLKQLRRKQSINEKENFSRLFEEFAHDVHIDEIKALKRHIETILPQSMAETRSTSSSPDVALSSYQQMITSSSKKVAITARTQHWKSCEIPPAAFETVGNHVYDLDKITKEAWMKPLELYADDRVDSDLKRVIESIISSMTVATNSSPENEVPTRNHSPSFLSFISHLNGFIDEESSDIHEFLPSILRLVLGYEIGLLNRETFQLVFKPIPSSSSSHSEMPIQSYLGSFLSMALKSIYKQISESFESDHDAVSLIQEMFRMGLGTVTTDLIHTLLIYSHDYLTNINNMKADNQGTGKGLENTFDEEIYRTSCWTRWEIEIGWIFYPLVSLLELLMIGHCDDNHEILLEARATLRWYVCASGLFGRISSLLYILSRNVSSVNFLLTAVLSPLQIISQENPIRSTAKDFQNINAISKKSKKQSNKAQKKSQKASQIGTKTSSGQNDDSNETLGPWNLLALSIHSLLVASTASLSKANSITVPRYYRVKEIISTLRTSDIVPCLLALLSSVVNEYIIRGHINHSNGLESFSLIQDDSIKQGFTWKKVEQLVLTKQVDIASAIQSNRKTKASSTMQPSNSPSYANKLFSTICTIVQTLSELCEVDPSLLQSLSESQLSSLSLVTGAIISSFFQFGPSILTGNTAARSDGSPTSSRANSMKKSKYSESKSIIYDTSTPSRSTAAMTSRGGNSGASTPSTYALSPSSVRRPASSSLSSSISDTDRCVCRLLDIINKAASRRSDIQLIFSQTYETLRKRIISPGSNDSSGISIASDIQTLYESMTTIYSIMNRSNVNEVNVFSYTVSDISARSLLRDLCHILPGRYFNDDRLKHVLLPAFVTMTLDCDNALVALRGAISSSILTTYLAKLLRDLQENQRGEDNVSSLKEDNSTPRIPCSNPILDMAARRLPVSLWAIALEIYSTNAGSSDSTAIAAGI